MSEIEQRVRAAAEAAARAVRDVRPLDLPPLPARHPGRLRRGHPRPPARWAAGRRGWMVPLAAAAAVFAIAAALVSVHRFAAGRVPPQATIPAAVPEACKAVVTPRGSTAPPAPPPVHPALPVAGLPQYAVVGCGAPGDSWLAVVSTLTGAPLAAVAMPRGWVPSYGYMSAGDLAFLIGAAPNGPKGLQHPQRWYLLRITPGQRVTATLTRAPFTIPGTATGVALSPDGSEIAIATMSPPSSAQAVISRLQLYSALSGRLLRTWNAIDTPITASLADGSFEEPGSTLRWSADGYRLAFAADYGTSIWLLDTRRATGAGLLAASTELLASSAHAPAPGPGYPLTCDLTQGWAVSADGRFITCAVAGGPGLRYLQSGNCPVSLPPVTAGIARFAALSGRLDHFLYAQTRPCDTNFHIWLAWASPDGNTAVGQVVTPVQHGPLEKFGYLRDGRFSPLPTSGNPDLMGALFHSYLHP